MIFQLNTGMKASKMYQNLLIRESRAMYELDMKVGNGHSKGELISKVIL